MEDQKTNFFSILEPLLANGVDLTLTIRKQEDKLVVGVRPQRTDVKKLDGIRPMVLTHSSADLDESFFTTIGEPIKVLDTTADEIKTFTDSVQKAKDEATKKKSEPVKASTSSKSKKKPAPGKSKGAGPVPSKPESAKQTPEDLKKEKEEMKRLNDEKAKNEKLAEIKAYLESGQLKVKDNVHAGLEEFTKGAKLAKGFEPAKELNEQLTAEIKSANEILQKERNLELAKPLVEQAEAKAKILNFGEAGELLKKIFALVPEHPEAMKVRQSLIDKLGEGFVKQLLGEKTT